MLQGLQHRARVAVNHVEKNQRCAAGCTVATFPVAQRGHREPKACCELLLRQAQALTLQLRIEVFMRPDREQNQHLGRQLVWLQPVGQQSFLLVELEFVDEHALAE